MSKIEMRSQNKKQLKHGILYFYTNNDINKIKIKKSVGSLQTKYI